MKKDLLLIVWILLSLFGCFMSLGAAVVFLEGSSPGDPTGIFIFVFILLGIAPIAGGAFLCWRTLSQRGSGRATASSVVRPGQINAPMKGLLLIVGILLILVGCVMSLGKAVEILEASSPDSAIAIMGFILLGIAPVAGGGVLCWRALSQRGSSVE